MNTENKWQQFMTSGKIEDYLNYKNDQRELSFSAMKENTNHEYQNKSGYCEGKNTWQ